MLKTVQVLILLVIYINCNAQFFKNKKAKKLNINYSLSTFYNKGNSVLTKRTPKGEFKKIEDVFKDDRLTGLQLIVGIVGIESILDSKQSGSPGYEKAFYDVIKDITAITTPRNIELDLSDYEKEFAFYTGYAVKSKEVLAREANQNFILEAEAENQKRRESENAYKKTLKLRRDSIEITQKREREIKDSTDQVNEKIEIEKQKIEYKKYQKRLDDKLQKEQLEKIEKEKRRKSELIQHYGEESADLILIKKVKIGWTKEMCLESWGKPQEINKTTTANLIHEQWVYSLKRYLYFNDDLLAAIQE